MSITALVLGDLHFPYEYRFYRFKRLLRDTNPDLILFCGDIINVGKKELLEKFLEETHKVSDAKIIAVMGNHDFWLPRDTYIPPSRTSWYNILIFQRVFKKFGDILLWKDPFIFEDIGFVGVPGWFDFTFAPWHLGFKLTDFLYGFYDNMIWNDTQFVDFRMSPMKATKIHIHMLKRQLDKIVSEGLKKIIVLLHFVPLGEFIPKTSVKKEAFWKAYYGSKFLGKTILNYRKYVNQVYFGHLSPQYLTSKKIVKDGIPFESVDVTDNIYDSRLISL